MKNFSTFAYKKAQLAAAAALVALLAGCSGGSSPDFPVDEGIKEGTMIDGPVEGGTVFCDLNGNGVQDAGEVLADPLDPLDPSKTTKADGKFTFSKGCKGVLYGYGGTNTDTGFAFTGKMTAPKGSLYLTPLTTLLVEAQAAGITEEQLLTQLGLPTTISLTRPKSGDEPTVNIEVFKATLVVQQIVDQLLRASSASSKEEKQAVYAKVAQGVVAGIKALPTGTALVSGGSLNVAALQTVVAKVVDTVTIPGVSKTDVTQIEQIAKELKTQGQVLLDVKSTEDLQKVTKELQKPEVKVPVKPITDYFALDNDSVTFNGTQTVTLAALKSPGVALTDGLKTIGMHYVPNGTPAVGISSVGIEFTEVDPLVGDKPRVLQLVLDKVEFTLNAQKQLSLSVPAGAKVHLYGKTRKGTEVTASAPDVTDPHSVQFSNNVLTLNYDSMVQRVYDRNKTDLDVGPNVEQFLALKGKFKFTGLVSKNINLRQVDTTPLPTSSILVKDSKDKAAVVGSGVSGLVTIQ